MLNSRNQDIFLPIWKTDRDGENQFVFNFQGADGNEVYCLIYRYPAICSKKLVFALVMIIYNQLRFCQVSFLLCIALYLDRDK